MKSLYVHSENITYMKGYGVQKQDIITKYHLPIWNRKLNKRRKRYRKKKARQENRKIERYSKEVQK